MMKKFLMLGALTALGSLAAYGQICVNVSSTLDNGQNLSGGAATCTLSNGLVFSNFNEYTASGFPTSGLGSPALLTVTVSGNFLDFSTDGLAGEDVQITFNVTSGTVTNATIGTGPGDTVSEFLCSAAFTQPSEVCNGTILNQSILDSSNGVGINGSNGTTVVTASTPDFILKDDSGGSGFSEGFSAASTGAPEPISLGIVGGGLLLLGLSRRIRGRS